MQVLSTGATAKKVQEQAENGQPDVAEALGRIAELEAELERTRGMLHDAEAENLFFFSSRRRHTRLQGDWSSDVCSSDIMIRHTRLQGDWSSDVCSSDLWLNNFAIKRTAFLFCKRT